MTESQQQILNDLPDYPYELFWDEDEGIHYCLIDGCNREFDSYDDYLEHFRYNNSHTSFIKRNLMKFNPREGLGEELVWDPIEKRQIEWNIKNNPLYEALKYNRDATPILDEKIKFAVKHNRNIIAIFIGVPGAGKTYATIALAYNVSGQFAEALGRQTRVDLRFTQADFLELVTENVDCEGDSLIQDEDPTGFGSGQKTNVGAFENLGKTVRKKNLNIYVVSPVEPDIKNIGFIIEWFAYYPDSRITKGVLYTRQKRALGYVYVEILDPEDYVVYEEMKDEFLDNMIATGGFGVENYSDERILRDYNILLDFVLSKEGKMTKTRVMGCASVKVRGDTKYQGFIADDVWEQIKDGKPPGQKKQDSGAGGLGSRKLGWDEIETIHDSEIGSLIHKHSRPTTRHQELGKAWWKYYFCTRDAKGEQAKDFINEDFNEDFAKTAFYNTFFPAFTKDEQCFGKAVERAIQERYYPEHAIDGSTGMPDLIGEDDFYEVKARKKGTTRDIYGYFNDKSYIWDLLKSGANVRLVEVEYAPKQQFTITVYQLYLREDESNDESG